MATRTFKISMNREVILDTELFISNILYVISEINLCRLKTAGGKGNINGTKKTRTRDRAMRAVPAPDANAELQVNIDVC